MIDDLERNLMPLEDDDSSFMPMMSIDEDDEAQKSGKAFVPGETGARQHPIQLPADGRGVGIRGGHRLSS